MTTMEDLKSMLEEDFDDMESEDFVELCQEIEALVRSKKQEAQSKVNQSVESLVDSFGGKDLTMRDLKGDL